MEASFLSVPEEICLYLPEESVMTFPELVAIHGTTVNPQFLSLPIHIAPSSITSFKSQKSTLSQGQSRIHVKMEYTSKELQDFTYLYKQKSRTCMGMNSKGVGPDGRNITLD